MLPVGPIGSTLDYGAGNVARAARGHAAVAKADWDIELFQSNPTPLGWSGGTPGGRSLFAEAAGMVDVLQLMFVN
jgi:hypothetical protein